MKANIIVALAPANHATGTPLNLDKAYDDATTEITRYTSAEHEKKVVTSIIRPSHVCKVSSEFVGEQLLECWTAPRNGLHHRCMRVGWLNKLLSAHRTCDLILVRFARLKLASGEQYFKLSKGPENATRTH
jgi:hypothetical protein